MKIIVLGHTGFVGRTIFQLLAASEHSVEGINSRSPQIDTECDIVVNCAGNSKKYFAEKSYDAAHLLEEKILDRFKRIKTRKVIQVSSIAVEDRTNYGATKRYVEEEIKKISFDFCILRLGCLVGSGLSKNAVYDLVNNNPLYVSLSSTCNFIHTSRVAEFIDHLIEHWKSHEIINVAATKSISVGEMATMMKKVPQIRENARTEHCQIDTDKLQTFFETKDSKYYIEQYLKEEGYNGSKITAT